MPKREVCVSFQERGTLVQLVTFSKHEVCDSLAQRETRIQTKAAPTRDLRISLQKHEAHVQPQVAKNNTELGSLHPYEIEPSSIDIPVTDLRDLLNSEEECPPDHSLMLL